MFFTPIAHADFAPPFYFVPEAFLHYLRHRSTCEVLIIVVRYRMEPEIQRILAHLEIVLAVLQLLAIRMIPEPDEGVARVPEELTEDHRHGVGVSELEDEAAATNAELQGVCLRIVSAGSPLDAEADDEAVEVVVVAAKVECGGEPPSDDGGGRGDGDHDFGSVEIDDIDFVLETVLMVDDEGHEMKNCQQPNTTGFSRENSQLSAAKHFIAMKLGKSLSSQIKKSRAPVRG
ncbi:hypothetical protein SESBI_18856 [Sesbania bispinosa]|nr:hypothetical protein SESBI_18856 [Sesbania bispinosa]